MKTYSINELVELTKLSARAIRSYAAQNMIPTPRFAGSATRYPRETMGKLRAIRGLRTEHKLMTPAIKRQLREWGSDEWEAWAEEADPIAAKPQTAPVATTAVEPASTPTPQTSDAGASDALVVGERWVQVPLIPGLMLMLRDGAGEMTLRVAHEIQKRYRAG